MALSGGWRGRGAHDIDGTSARAREKRETNRTTRARLEQQEVRGAFCSAFLARARADSVGGGAPACTAQPRLAGILVFFLKFQARETGHFADPNTLQGLFSCLQNLQTNRATIEM